MNWGIFGLILLLIVIGLAVWAIAVSNSFKVLLVKITEADSGIDVALTKRFGTLNKLLDVVRAYAKHETALFEKLVTLHSGMSVAEKSEANHHMNELAQRIHAVAEHYLELRSSDNYKQLRRPLWIQRTICRGHGGSTT